MVDLEQIRLHCISKDGINESFPFNEDTLVIKTNSKIFALLSLNQPFTINLKCDPQKAVLLREEFDFVKPGYHMNKKHWNTIELDAAPINLVKEWIDHSYDLIVAKTKKPKKSSD